MTIDLECHNSKYARVGFGKLLKVSDSTVLPTLPTAVAEQYQVVTIDGVRYLTPEEFVAPCSPGRPVVTSAVKNPSLLARKGVHTAAALKATPAASPKWEYTQFWSCRTATNFANYGASIIKSLNEYGVAGWELIGFSPVVREREVDCFVGTFKRSLR